MEENFRLTRDNGIWIPDFIDDFKDDWLYILKDFLLKMAQNDVSDVRPIIRKYRDNYEMYQ